MSRFCLVVHHYEEKGRISVQWFPEKELAEEHGRRLQASFPVDFYVTQVLSRHYGKRRLIS